MKSHHHNVLILQLAQKSMTMWSGACGIVSLRASLFAALIACGTSYPTETYFSCTDSRTIGISSSSVFMVLQRGSSQYTFTTHTVIYLLRLIHVSSLHLHHVKIFNAFHLVQEQSRAICGYEHEPRCHWLGVRDYRIGDWSDNWYL